jgi:6-phosphogluconolactonase
MIWLAAIALAGTAMNVPAQGLITIVYISNGESNEIQVLRLNRSTGDLKLIETVPIPGITKPGMSTPLAISPDRRFLFVATRGEPQAVHTFGIDAGSGKLKYIGNGPLVDSMPYIVADRSGRWLFAASYPGHKLSVSPIGSNGVAQATRQVLENHTNAHSILPDPQNRFVLAATLGKDLMNVFRFNAKTGKLAPHTPASVSVKSKTGPRHFVFHPNGKWIYLLGELDASVHVFAYDAVQGTLKEKQAADGLPPGATGRIAAADLHITPDGKYLYSTERASSTITGFKVDPKEGTLTLLEHLPTEGQPRGFAIEPAGRFLYVAGQRSHRVSGYEIDAISGTLIKLKEYPAGRAPNWIEIVELPGK